MDETDTAITQQALAHALQTARTAQRKAEADYNHLLQDFCEKVYFYHPLIMMDNNFISIDTYNYWRKIYKEQWDEVTKKDPDMFAILDALVKSRKIYLKEINK